MTDTEVVHELDVGPDAFEAMVAGDLRHDLRRLCGRPFAPGDGLRYREVDPVTGRPTGRSARGQVSYVTWTGNQCALSPSGLDPRFAILSLEEVVAEPA